MSKKTPCVLVYHDSNFYFTDFFQILRYFSALSYHILMEYLYFHLVQKLLDSYNLFFSLAEVSPYNFHVSQVGFAFLLTCFSFTFLKLSFNHLAYLSGFLGC